MAQDSGSSGAKKEGPASTAQTALAGSTNDPSRTSAGVGAASSTPSSPPPSDSRHPTPASTPRSKAAEVDIIGEVLDERYRVLKLLGEGGMGQVYLAEHVHIEKKVAVKLLRREILSHEEAVVRFRQEARSASSIGHKNIIAIEDFGTLADGRVYMCMEYLDGTPLNDLLKEGLDPSRALSIMIQTGHGLAAAHQKQIIHRDMKPENVFVTDVGGDETPKLLDFGIAKVAGEGNNNLTRTGTVFGTPFYMAPEQALGQPVDHRADVYAMGVILFEVFCGQVPFIGDAFMAVLYQHINDDPPSPSETARTHRRELPKGIDKVILRCLAKDPETRYGTMDELVNALVEVYRTTAGAGMSSYVNAAEEPVDFAPSRRNRGALLAFSAVVVAAIGGLFAWQSTQETVAPPATDVPSVLAPTIKDTTPPTETPVAIPAAVADAAPVTPPPVTPPPVAALKNILVDSNPDGAFIYYEGNRIGKTPDNVQVKIPAIVELKKKGYVTTELTLDGEREKVTHRLKKEKKKEPKLPAITVDSFPRGATIFHKGVRLGKTPKKVRVALPTTIWLRKTGYKKLVLAIDGSKKSIRPRLIAKTPRKNTAKPDDSHELE